MGRRDVSGDRSAAAGTPAETELGLLRRYGGPVPRYTSYPTAAQFHSEIGPRQYGEWLARLSEGPASLYVHVPFCAEICWYCGCHTKAARRYAPVAAYAELLAAEIALVANAVPRRLIVTHVHFGGGTPTMLSRADFLAVKAAAERHFDLARDAEIAAECDPRVLTEEAIAALAEAGVTRVSLGVQDFNPAVQKAVNRIQPFETVADAIDRLRAAGIQDINLDLMYGLPFQSVSDCIRTVDLAVSLDPARLAVFGYAHVPWLKSHQRRIETSALPGPEERMAQSEAVAVRLVEKGYRRIGLDHFAKPGDGLTIAHEAGRLRRNFQGYTTDTAGALLGFGASAIGTVNEGFVQNAVPMRAYADAVRNGRFATSRGIALRSEDHLRGQIIERLMCDLSADLKLIAGRHHAPPEAFSEEKAALAQMQEDGLVEIEDLKIRVTGRGRPFLRSVAAVFDRYLRPVAGRHAAAV